MRLRDALALSCLVLFAAQADAQEKAAPAAAITEVRAAKTDDEDTSVLIQVAAKLKRKLREGQSLEVRRAGKTIGYGSVDKVFSNVVVATIGTIVDDDTPPKKGDAVTFLASGFKQPARPAPRQPKPEPKKILGKVVGVRDGIVLLGMGSKNGLQTGHLVVLRDPKSRAEVGRIAVELLGDTSGGGMLLSGSAKVGLEALVVGKVRGKAAGGDEPGIDFVKIAFLGCVADIEHPSPHRSACHVGVPVRRVLRGSPAEKSGIGRGDRILSVDGIVVRDIASVRKRIQARASARVRVLILRGDRLVQIDVDFGRR